MVSSQELESAIRQKVQNVSTLVVSDVSGGCGQAYDVVIVSDAFEGLNTLKRHRMVNELLKDEIAQLHAFSQKTYTVAQYEQMSSSSAAPAPSSTKPTSADLQAPAPINTRPSHNRTASGVSIPELTLTTDDETLSGLSSRNAGKPLGPGAQPGGTSTQYPGTAVPPPLSPSISRLHKNRIRSTEFWTGLRSYLELQFSGPNVEAGAASPGPSGRNPGDAEVERIFEDFFLSQKHHLTASDIAKVRDATGMFGMAGV
ncbi:hypothetical protein NDA16_000090 [Ustilago loliicola]|nr:hypothetical protein NDA16_000090 [Ustilago loliicola]